MIAAAGTLSAIVFAARSWFVIDWTDEDTAFALFVCQICRVGSPCFP